MIDGALRQLQHFMELNTVDPILKTNMLNVIHSNFESEIGLRSVEIDLLQTIVAFADTGTCMGAADIVGRSQSAVSIKLKKLEQQLGTSLFLRQGRSLELNDQGRHVVADARQILRLNNDLVRRVTATMLTGTVRLGLPDDYVEMLPAFLQQFSAKFPAVNLAITCLPSAQLRPLLQRGELELAILSSETDTKEGFVLKVEPVHWVASRLSDVRRMDMVPLALAPEGCIFRKWGLNALTRMGRDYQIICTSQNAAALKAVVQSGLALSIFARDEVPPGSDCLGEADGFPALPPVTIMLLISPRLRDPRQSLLAQGLAEMLGRVGERSAPPTAVIGSER